MPQNSTSTTLPLSLAGSMGAELIHSAAVIGGADFAWNCAGEPRLFRGDRSDFGQSKRSRRSLPASGHHGSL